MEEFFCPNDNETELFQLLVQEVGSMDASDKDPGGTPYNGLYGEAPLERRIFFSKRYIKGVPFLPNGIQKGKGLDLGAEPPRITLC